MRTRAKRKRVAEIKLQEVDDMYQILMPGRTMVGENAISMAKEQISGLGSHALIISGKIVEKSGIVKKLTDSLDEAGVSYTIFTDIKGEPDDLMVAAAKNRGRQSTGQRKGSFRSIRLCTDRFNTDNCRFRIGSN